MLLSEGLLKNGHSQMYWRESFFCEKVLMPFEMYFFEAPDDARLELWLLNGGEPMLHNTFEAKEYALLSNRRLGDP